MQSRGPKEKGRSVAGRPCFQKSREGKLHRVRGSVRCSVAGVRSGVAGVRSSILGSVHGVVSSIRSVLSSIGRSIGGIVFALRASGEAERSGENERKSNRLGHGQTPLRDKNVADHSRRKVHPPLRLRGRFVMPWITQGNPHSATRQFPGFHFCGSFEGRQGH